MSRHCVESPLAQGRGSKLFVAVGCRDLGEVAPRAGAWIETWRCAMISALADCRPSRRGVDRNDSRGRFALRKQVAPRAGAWIETPSPCLDKPHQMSPLAQGRGSKLLRRGLSNSDSSSPLAQGRGSKQRERADALDERYVAPRAGAWIETETGGERVMPEKVAPRAGAWIETPTRGRPTRGSSCRPSRRGVDRNSG